MIIKCLFAKKFILIIKKNINILTKNTFKNKNKENKEKLKETPNVKFIEYKEGEAPLKIEKENDNDNLKILSKKTKLYIENNIYSLIWRKIYYITNLF